MKVLWRYTIRQDAAIGRFTANLEIPRGGVLRYFGVDRGHPWDLWFEVDDDPSIPIRTRTFILMNNGEVPTDAVFLGANTDQSGFVHFLYEDFCGDEPMRD